MAIAHPIPKMIGVSELRLRQREILEQISDGPIVLSQRSQPLAVLVDVALWNRVLEELATLRDAQIATERLTEAKQDPALLASLEDVEAELTHEDERPLIR